VPAVSGTWPALGVLPPSAALWSAEASCSDDEADEFWPLAWDPFVGPWPASLLDRIFSKLEIWSVQVPAMTGAAAKSRAVPAAANRSCIFIWRLLIGLVPPPANNAAEGRKFETAEFWFKSSGERATRTAGVQVVWL